MAWQLFETSWTAKAEQLSGTCQPRCLMKLLVLGDKPRPGYRISAKHILVINLGAQNRSGAQQNRGALEGFIHSRWLRRKPPNAMTSALKGIKSSTMQVNCDNHCCLAAIYPSIFLTKTNHRLLSYTPTCWPRGPPTHTLCCHVPIT